MEEIENKIKIEMEEDALSKIKKIVVYAKDIEAEGSSTRYGEIIEDKFNTPEEKYNKKIVKKFLNDMSSIINLIADLFRNTTEFENDTKKFEKYRKNSIK
ncbi:MAG: hypothetical protein GF383_15425 [Candidatus Lokiarchaeota archaeon]|nr:hypothetical protein [Candidatus Lokiarchaeota archaeon]